MADILHRTVTANGIRIHLAEAGEGTLVVLCHGFPESWYSWRHQLEALAEAGYRAVAPDMRGYGRSSRPGAIAAYALTHLVGDVVGIVGALGVERAVVVGHDWGAPVAWYSALMRPDLFWAVAALSVPYNPPMSLPPGVTISDLMAAAAGKRDFYRLRFQEPGRAEAELEADVAGSVLGILNVLSGDVGPGRQWDGYLPRDAPLSSVLTPPDRLPPWLSQADLDVYVAEFERTGFTGGLNWYRNIDALPSALAPFAGATLAPPALFIAGEHDRIAGNTPRPAAMAATLPDLRGLHVLGGAGHWLQQERPGEVNSLLLDFLRSLA